MSQKNHSFKSSLVSTRQLASTCTKRFSVVPAASTMSFFKEKRANMQRMLAAASFATLLLVGCQKEELINPSLNTAASDNLSALAAGTTAPAVNAGADQMVVDSSFSNSFYSSAKLRGSVSSTSSTVQWQQISGVSAATIEKPTSVTTKVSNLKPGVYTFVLTATDTQGIISTDTTSVSVLKKMTWTIEGVTREALVHPSSNSSVKAPVIFAFHGHNSSDRVMAENGFELQWPEAIVIYPQGLVRDETGSGSGTGWQESIGEKNIKTGVVDDDIKLFDAIRSTVIDNYGADLSKIFVHGWSNGGRFVVNVLWAARADKMAALAPASTTVKSTTGKRTMPIIHVAGTSDDKVSFSGQQKSSEKERSLNQCSTTGTTWATGPTGILGTKYPSTIHNPVVFLKYNGEHRYPVTVVPHIVQFFKDIEDNIQ